VKTFRDIQEALGVAPHKRRRRSAATYDPTAGATSKDAGMKRVANNQPDGWYESVLAAMRELATIQDDFTMEQVRVRAKEIGVPEPTHPNAWGPATRMAIKAGIVRATHRFITHRLPSAHARRVMVLQSAIRKPA
jgi:hypothetical protein